MPVDARVAPAIARRVNRLTTTAMYGSNGSGNASDFDRDGLGVPSRSDTVLVTTRVYNDDGTLLSVSGAYRRVRRTTIDYPTGHELSFYYGDNSASLGTETRTNHGLSRVETVRIKPSGGSNVTEATYDYLGLGRVVRTDLPVPEMWSTVAGSSSTYPGLDRFNRIVESSWTWDYTTGTDYNAYEVDLSYDRNSNITMALDQWHNGMDVLYAMDDLNRLTGAQRGDEASGSITLDTFHQEWTLDQTGNWDLFKNDLNGDTDGNTSLEWQWLAYDDRWRVVARYEDGAAVTEPFEQLYHHAAGLAGYGGSSYIDLVICRDRDTDTESGGFESREYVLQNWRADVIALYHCRLRVHHAGLGRWVQRDQEQFQYGEGMSLYWYGASSPVVMNDWLGGPCNPASCSGEPSPPITRPPGDPRQPPSDPSPTPPQAGLSVQECNDCAAQAMAEEGNAALITRMRSLGCPLNFAGCEVCDESNRPGIKGWTTPDGTVHLCANRMPDCEYAKTMFSHELWHAYDRCQGFVSPGGNAGCCSCVCRELRAYRWDGGCRDGGVRRSIPGPGGAIPQTERDCLRMYVGVSCKATNQCTENDLDGCFSMMYTLCSPTSIFPPIPFVPPTIELPD